MTLPEQSDGHKYVMPLPTGSDDANLAAAQARLTGGVGRIIFPAAASSYVFNNQVTIPQGQCWEGWRSASAIVEAHGAPWLVAAEPVAAEKLAQVRRS